MIDRPPRMADTFFLENNYLKYSKPGKKKIKKLPLSDVYSVKGKDATEQIVYVQDPLETNAYTREELKFYVIGQEDARKGYRLMANISGGLGLIAGAAGSANALFGITVVGIYPGFVALLKPPRAKVFHFKNEYRNDIFYKDGYRTQARRMATRRAFFGTAAGFALGTIARILMKK